MSDFPSLADVIRTHRFEESIDDYGGVKPHPERCSCGQWPASWNDDSEYGDHVQQVWREACTITTVEQLDALPPGAVIRDANDLISERAEDHPNGWHWLAIGWYDVDHANALTMPALLLWHPSWSAQ